MSQQSVNILPEALHTLGRPLDLSPDAFGFFRETEVDTDIEVQQNRISDEGYLYFRNFWSREQAVSYTHLTLPTSDLV